MHFKLLYTKVFNFNTTKVGGATEQPYWNSVRRDLSPCARRTTAQLICIEDGIAINDDGEFAPSLSWFPVLAESSALSTGHQHTARGDPSARRCPTGDTKPGSPARRAASTAGNMVPGTPRRSVPVAAGKRPSCRKYQALQHDFTPNWCKKCQEASRGMKFSKLCDGNVAVGSD